MDYDGMVTLAAVDGMDNVDSSQPSKFVEVIGEAIAKVESKQTVNIQDMSNARTKVDHASERLKSILAEERSLEDDFARAKEDMASKFATMEKKMETELATAKKKMETELATAKKTMEDELAKKKDVKDAAVRKKQTEAQAMQFRIHNTNHVEIATLEQEAFEQKENENFLLKARNVLDSLVLVAPEDRFLGANGEGNATYMKKVTHLVSKGDAKQCSVTKLRSSFCFAVLLGMETDKEFVASYDQASPELQSLLGKPGHIPCSHHLTKDEVVDIACHLYKLSLVETPPGKKRRAESALRSTKARRAESALRSTKARRKNRLSQEEEELLESLTKKLEEDSESD